MQLRKLLRALSRWTLLVFLWPHKYVEPSTGWAEFPLWDWTATTYDYTPDHLLLDYAQDPHYTVEAGTGDCEDYALVAATWALSTGREGVGLAVTGHWVGPIPVPTHVIAYDAERVYSSGVIYADMSPTDYVANDNRYSWVLSRPL